MAVDVLSRAQNAFENLNARERVFILALGGVVVAMIVALPLYLLASSISDMKDDNRQISLVLRDISRARGTLAQRQAERQAASARYANPAPPLGSFLEAEATGQSLSLREVTDQPEKVIGEFRRRNVRATLPSVELRPAVKLLTAIENSEYPVALERIQIEHFRGGDAYNVSLGVIAYDQTAPAEAEAEEESSPAERRRRRREQAGMAGPPAP